MKQYHLLEIAETKGIFVKKCLKKCKNFIQKRSLLLGGLSPLIGGAKVTPTPVHTSTVKSYSLVCTD